MASEEQSKPPDAVGVAVVAAPAAAAPPSDWAASVHAYYVAAAAAAAHPYAWPAQPLLAPYGTPIPFPYHSGTFYGHPALCASMAYPTSQAETQAVETKNKNGSPEKSSGDGAAKLSSATSGDGASSSDNSSEGSSGTREEDAEPKILSSNKRPKNEATYIEGVPSETATRVPGTNTMVESAYALKGRSPAKLPVSAPGRAALPSTLPNLNIGIDVWGTSQPVSVPVNSGSAVLGRDIMSKQQVLDERELKRERRKQSNRESARRSRLRKQQECEELAKKVSELSTENSMLKAELEQLKKACEDMEAENTRIIDEMAAHSQVPTAVPSWAIQSDTQKGVGA